MYRPVARGGAADLRDRSPCSRDCRTVAVSLSAGRRATASTCERDRFVHRLDAGATATTTLYAVRRGQPAVGLTIHLTLTPGAGKGSVLAVPSQVVTGVGGTAIVSLTGADPRNPRGAVDGVVETVAYSTRLTRPPRELPDYAGTGLDPRVDVLVAHVRDAFSIPTDPDWARDVQPLLAQYARLYRSWASTWWILVISRRSGRGERRCCLP